MDLFKIIQSLQDLVYEIIVWVLLLPKTIIRAVFRPDLMVAYVNTEWKKKPEKQFDEYLAPVLFFLILAVIPSAIYSWGSQMIGEDVFTQLTESNLLASSLTTLLTLFIYLTWLEWLNKRPIRRSTLKRLFFIQCYLVTPAQFLYALLLMFGMKFIDVNAIFICGAVLLTFYEAFAFQDELKTSWVKGLAYAILPQVVLVLLFTLLFLFYPLV